MKYELKALNAQRLRRPKQVINYLCENNKDSISIQTLTPKMGLRPLSTISLMEARSL